jgi:predicted DNA-binding antitoxin AbrB/MazE fold protein
MGVVHSTLFESLNIPHINGRMNILDEKRRKKVLHNLESIKSWISKEVDFDEGKRYEIVKELNKISRALRQLAIDVREQLEVSFSSYKYSFYRLRYNHHYLIYSYG